MICIMVNTGETGGMIMGFTQPDYDIHSSPWFVDGPNRNRWFTWVYRSYKHGDFPWRTVK